MIWIFQPNIKDDNEIALEDVASLKTYLIFINIYCLNLIFRECYESLENKEICTNYLLCLFVNVVKEIMPQKVLLSNGPLSTSRTEVVTHLLFDMDCCSMWTNKMYQKCYCHMKHLLTSRAKMRKTWTPIIICSTAGQKIFVCKSDYIGSKSSRSR